MIAANPTISGAVVNHGGAALTNSGSGTQR